MAHFSSLAVPSKCLRMFKWSILKKQNKTMNRQARFRRSVSLDPEVLARDAFTREVSLQKSISTEEGKAESKEVKLDLGVNPLKQGSLTQMSSRAV